MEQQSNSQAPDLATVLRNLAALAPPPAQQPTGPSLDGSQSSATPQALPDFGRHAVPAHPANHRQSSDPRLAGCSQKPASQNYSSVSTTPPGSPLPALVPQSSAPTPIDPATITEWAPGLRCITKIAAQNHNFKPIIQKMIADQHEHELIWWGGRQALMSQSANKEQLKAYDRKVHRAQSEMFYVMSGQLKSLGVPFFGVKPGLVASAEEAAAGAGSGADSKAKVTPDELLKLQKKMIEYLEDMYKD
ncbi:hypothetical protein GTA08_BOTSDO05999 [Botryosphaeria dothidea]|uniref:Uncharacterized protein n=1 Tax=Botryosphaeria dothidea TaxID=55169 RepID=A0A8H4ITJ6_9PEZI|nr:hypothetical protein GTA08_BOTSDO05999 [Botryosphaeria dothidea]